MILLDLFSFTDLREIQFASVVTVFVDDTGCFSFLLSDASVRRNFLLRLVSIQYTHVCNAVSTR